MNENLPNDIDRIFNQKLKKFETSPSDGLWNKIEDSLNEYDTAIIVFSSGSKRFAAAAVLLIAGLGFLIKMYFSQQTIFKQELAKKGKGEIGSVLIPKSDLHESAQLSKTGLLAIGHQTDKHSDDDIISDKLSKSSGSTFQKSDAAGSVVKNNNGEFLFAEADSYVTPEHKMSIQAVVSNLQFPKINPPVLSMKKNGPESLTVIHQKKRFADWFSIAPYYSKEFAGYSLSDNDLTGVNRHEIERRERNVFSASVGFFINYSISKRWMLQSGIAYSWSKSNIDSCTSYAVKVNTGNIQYKLNTISGYGYLEPSSSTQTNVGDSVSTAKTYSQLHYLTVPLVLSYRIPLGRFSILVGAGATFNILTGAEIETKTYGSRNPEKEYTVNMMGLKKTNYGMIVKLDLEYHLNSHIGVNVIPSFKNTLSPINLQTAVSAYPYNFGIGVGMTYRF